MYVFIGEIDFAISTASIKSTKSHFCTPTFIQIILRSSASVVGLED
jgi:hypothetical protein